LSPFPFHYSRRSHVPDASSHHTITSDNKIFATYLACQ
jgi:hypothetical protein